MNNAKTVHKFLLKPLPSPLVYNTKRFSIVFPEIFVHITDRRLTEALEFFESRGCDSQAALFFIANLQDLMGGAE
jgi:hypothetical protein